MGIKAQGARPSAISQLALKHRKRLATARAAKVLGTADSDIRRPMTVWSKGPRTSTKCSPDGSNMIHPSHGLEIDRSVSQKNGDMKCFTTGYQMNSTSA